MKSRLWLIFAIVTTTFWGLWGALIEIPERAGFPATLGYSVWSLTMIPPAIVALKLSGWTLHRDRRSVLLGSAAGLLGAGGQLILFQALTLGPAYIVFPLISLAPLVTILMSLLLLKEKTTLRGWLGISLALIAVPLLSYQPPGDSVVRGFIWLVLSMGVFVAWGVQGYVIKFANRTMSAESVFFYMMATAVLLMPVALLMTDFSQPINWGLNGPYLAAAIQVLNSVGALCLVFAFRYGKAIIVSPMTNALAPVLTVLISLMIYAIIPHTVTLVGMVMAIVAAFLMAIEEETDAVVTEMAVEETRLIS
jgi:drug/metabolite transporter (DMT)-like permease